MFPPPSSPGGSVELCCVFTAARSGLYSCISTELVQPWCLWAHFYPVLHFTSLQTPLQIPSQVFTRASAQEVGCASALRRDQSCWVISKGQGSKRSITILLRVFTPIYSIGTAAMPGVLLWRPCDVDRQPQRRSSPAPAAWLGQELPECRGGGAFLPHGADNFI